MRRLPVLAFALLLAWPAGGARAQMDSREGIALQNQILELRRDLQAVQSDRGGALPPPVVRGGGGGGGSQLSTELLDRVARLEDEMRRLRGQVDELANANRRQQDELAKQVADLNFKLGNSGAGAAAASVAAAGAAGAASVGPVRRPAELAMQEGNAALARRDYPAAEAAAREVLTGSRGPRANDAQFLLAQALTGKRDFQGAAIAYDDAYNRSRTGPRAPDALLGVANALLALNERGAACTSLDKLGREFRSVRADVRDSASVLRVRAGCK